MPKEGQPIKCHICGTILSDMGHFKRHKKIHKQKLESSEISHPGTWELVSTNGRLVPAFRKMFGKKVRKSDSE
jgi:hypothetical protein